MNSNDYLKELRELVEKQMHGMLDDNQVHRMAELVEALDSYLSNGGFLPDDWRPKVTKSTPQMFRELGVEIDSLTKMVEDNKAMGTSFEDIYTEVFNRMRVTIYPMISRLGLAFECDVLGESVEEDIMMLVKALKELREKFSILS